MAPRIRTITPRRLFRLAPAVGRDDGAVVVPVPLGAGQDISVFPGTSGAVNVNPHVVTVCRGGVVDGGHEITVVPGSSGAVKVRPQVVTVLTGADARSEPEQEMTVLPGRSGRVRVKPHVVKVVMETEGVVALVAMTATGARMPRSSTSLCIVSLDDYRGLKRVCSPSERLWRLWSCWRTSDR